MDGFYLNFRRVSNFCYELSQWYQLCGSETWKDEKKETEICQGCKIERHTSHDSQSTVAETLTPRYLSSLHILNFVCSVLDWAAGGPDEEPPDSPAQSALCPRVAAALILHHELLAAKQPYQPTGLCQKVILIIVVLRIRIQDPVLF